MGYDLYVCNSDGSVINEEPAQDAPVSMFGPVVYQPLYYLRRNIFGMDPLRDALRSVRHEGLSMGYWASYTPEFPGATATEEEVLRWLRATGDETPGIPLHKLCSNDGWWVTAPECHSAFSIWQRAGYPDQEDFRDDFIPFLCTAATLGGFRVY